jgi:hypothetical protein
MTIDQLAKRMLPMRVLFRSNRLEAMLNKLLGGTYGHSAFRSTIDEAV